MEQGLIVFFGTSDLEATHRFYHDALELALERDQGLCRIYQVPGGGKIGFCTHLEKVNGKKSPLLTLVTPEVDEWYRRLKEKGIQVEVPPVENPLFGIYHFFLQDPNGYTVEIQRFVETQDSMHSHGKTAQSSGVRRKGAGE